MTRDKNARNEKLFPLLPSAMKAEGYCAHKVLANPNPQNHYNLIGGNNEH
jgi:hypothetical protein